MEIGFSMASSPAMPGATSTPVVRPDSSHTPGKWRHPRLDEIVTRQNASIFGQNNLRLLLWNGVVLTLLWIVEDVLKTW